MPSHWRVPSADLPWTRPRSVRTTRPPPWLAGAACADVGSRRARSVAATDPAIVSFLIRYLQRFVAAADGAVGRTLTRKTQFVNISHNPPIWINSFFTSELRDHGTMSVVAWLLRF